jgi:hypothetical protein
MSDELKRTVISQPNSAVYEVRIDLPKSLRSAISESLQRGKDAAIAETKKTPVVKSDNPPKK